METLTDFVFLGSRITVDGDCSHKIKSRLSFRRKAMTNLDSILKSRNSTLLTKVHTVEAMVFPVVMYRCQSWTKEKAECQRIDHLKLWCWKRLESRLDSKKIKPVSPSNEYSGLISFRRHWLDLLATQGTLKSPLQHHSSKASFLRQSAFFIVQLSPPYMTTGKP